MATKLFGEGAYTILNGEVVTELSSCRRSEKRSLQVTSGTDNLTKIDSTSKEYLITTKCHPESPIEALYNTDNNLITLRCKECQKVVIKLTAPNKKLSG